MHPWTLENAQAFVTDLQSRVRGYDLEIVGGVVRKGYSDKDVDIVLKKNADFTHADEAADAMAAMGADFKGRIDKIPMEGWFLADGRRVDFFYAEKGDKRKKRAVVETTMRDLIALCEGFGSYTEIEFVCINPTTGGSDPANIRTLHGLLSKMPGLVIVRQDYMEEAGHLAMTAIIVDTYAVSKKDVAAAARKAGVKIDVVNTISDQIMDEIYDGTYTNMIDMLATTDGFTRRGVCWSDEHAIA